MTVQRYLGSLCRAAGLTAAIGLACALLPAFGLAAAPAPVARSGQTSCFDNSGNPLADCNGTGQDGDYLFGVTWPSPRFRDNAPDDTFTDLLTGLTWTKNADAPGPTACTPGTTKDWKGALNYIKCLNNNAYLGKNDWRLPNIVELRSLFDAGQSSLNDWLNNLNMGIRNVHALSSDRYKSSSPGEGTMNNTPWVKSFYDGSSKGFTYTSLDHVWPVRGSSSAATPPLPKTGVAKCYDFTSNGTSFEVACAGTGQDGETQAGAAWPAPRFALGTATVIDNLTGLEWVRDGVTQNLAGCTGGLLNWQDALSFVDCLNTNQYQNRTDWRAPNINEMLSITSAAGGLSTWPWDAIDRSLLHQYWTGTTYLPDPSQAWTVEFGSVGGSLQAILKRNSNYILPVRNQGAGAIRPVTTPSVSAGTYTSAQSVTLACSDSGGPGCGNTYYSVDGSVPTLLYTQPISITATTTLKYFSKDTAGVSELINQGVYTINLPTVYKIGDVNKDGTIDLADALLVYKFYTHAQTPTSDQVTQADVAPLDANFNPVGNGTVDLGDVITIMRYVVGAVHW